MEKVRIKNFTEVITGGTPSTSKSEFWENGNIPWLNSGELNQKIVTSSKKGPISPICLHILSPLDGHKGLVT